MMTLAELRQCSQGGAIPSSSEAQQMVKQSKEVNPPQKIGGFNLVAVRPNIAFYADSDTVIVAIPGTRSASEAVAEWWRVPLGTVEYGARYKSVSEAVQAVRQEFPRHKFFGVGHSLAGAIIDELIDAGLVDGGKSFNPAVQPKHFGQEESKNAREFQEGDILGDMGRPFLPDATVRGRKGWAQKVAKAIIPLGSWWDLYDRLQAHKIDSFAEEAEGGGRYSQAVKDLAEAVRGIHPLSKTEFWKQVDREKGIVRDRRPTDNGKWPSTDPRDPIDALWQVAAQKGQAQSGVGKILLRLAAAEKGSDRFKHTEEVYRQMGEAQKQAEIEALKAEIEFWAIEEAAQAGYDAPCFAEEATPGRRPEDRIEAVSKVRHHREGFEQRLAQLEATPPPHIDGGTGGTGGTSGGIRPFLCRVGSKAKFAKLLDFIAPEHKVYVEPFAGSAAFFWHKAPAEKAVLNDLDKGVAKTLKLIKKAPTNISAYPALHSTKALHDFYMRKPKGTANELVWELISHCGGWMGQPVNANTGKIQRLGLEVALANKLKHIPEYKEKMKNTTVTSQDYAKVLRANNNANTFIFMDPPYEESSNFGYAEEEGFDFDRLAAEVKKLKANWLITINDSPRIRELFKAYHIQPVKILGHKRGTASKIKKTIGTVDRKEVLITNFPLPKGWQEHKGAMIGAGDLHGDGFLSNLFRRNAKVAPAPPTQDEIDYPGVPADVLEIWRQQGRVPGRPRTPDVMPPRPGPPAPPESPPSPPSPPQEEPIYEYSDWFMANEPNFSAYVRQIIAARREIAKLELALHAMKPNGRYVLPYRVRNAAFKKLDKLQNQSEAYPEAWQDFLVEADEQQAAAGLASLSDIDIHHARESMREILNPEDVMPGHPGPALPHLVIPEFNTAQHIPPPPVVPDFSVAPPLTHPFVVPEFNVGEGRPRKRRKVSGKGCAASAKVLPSHNELIDDLQLMNEEIARLRGVLMAQEADAAQSKIGDERLDVDPTLATQIAQYVRWKNDIYHELARLYPEELARVTGRPVLPGRTRRS